MNDNCITRFEVSNFKKFDHLVVENIGQVNLITGDNNVGKTCLLEALLLKPNMKSIISLLRYTLENRNFQFTDRKISNSNDIENNQKNNIIGLFQRDLDKPIEIIGYNDKGKLFQFCVHNKVINVVDTEDEAIRAFAKFLTVYPGISTYTKNWLLFYNHFNSNRATWEEENKLEYMVDLLSPYYVEFFNYEKRDYIISLNDFYKKDLVEFYEEITKSPKSKKVLIDNLNELFAGIKVSDIEKRYHLGSDHLMLSLEGADSWFSLTQFGDGFVRLLRILLEIMLRQSSRIMIDEVEVGVHYLKMKDEWKAIFELSKQTGIQIFATTHSLDCIKAFIEAGEENAEIKNDLRLIELEEFTTKDGATKHSATTFNYETLKYKIEMNTNVLGGDVWR